MKVISLVHSDDYTYSFEEALFVTNDELSADVHARLQRDYIITEEQLFKLACDKEIELINKRGCKETLTISDIEVL